jgi:type II secretory pathway component GspD/PulD (secretin)
VSQRNRGDAAEKRPAPLSRESLDDLIAKGSLRPVEATPSDPAHLAARRRRHGRPTAKHSRRASAKLKGEPHAGSAAVRRPSAAPAAGQAAAQAPAPETKTPPPPQPPQSGANPYLVFGKRIQVYPDTGLIMKAFPVRVGSGKQLLELLQTYGNFPLWQPGAAAQTADQVRLQLFEKFDQELYASLRISPPPADTPLAIADWLVVVASAPRLEDVESFINIFAAGVPQIEIEAKIVEVTVTNQLDLGVTPIDSSTPIFGFPSGGFVKSLDYNLPNTSGSINGLLTIGAVADGMHFNAVLQALATFENVSIISKPTIAVREGGRASIENTVRIPVYAVSASVRTRRSPRTSRTRKSASSCT